MNEVALRPNIWTPEFAAHCKLAAHDAWCRLCYLVWDYCTVQVFWEWFVKEVFIQDVLIGTGGSALTGILNWSCEQCTYYCEKFGPVLTTLKNHVIDFSDFTDKVFLYLIQTGDFEMD